MPSDGPILCGRYRLVHPIGRGGMADVWAAIQLSTGRRVAVKMLCEHESVEHIELDRFRAEARIAALIRSQHVVEVLDHDVDPERGPFIVMELLIGESLGERIRRCGALPLTEAVDIVVQTAKGLERAHDAGIIHRDVKPENVYLVRNEDEVEVAKLVDFGLAKARVVPREPTMEGYLVGTLEYMSPEQVAGGPVDGRSDLWSLAIVFLEAISGLRTFASSNPRTVVDSIREALLPRPSMFCAEATWEVDAWFEQATRRDVTSRFQSAAAFRAALAFACRDAVRGSGDARAADACYFVSDGVTVVGPVRGSVVVRGMDAGRVPQDAWIWRRAWSGWRCAAEVMGELVHGGRGVRRGGQS